MILRIKILVLKNNFENKNATKHNVDIFVMHKFLLVYMYAPKWHCRTHTSFYKKEILPLLHQAEMPLRPVHINQKKLAHYKKRQQCIILIPWKLKKKADRVIKRLIEHFIGFRKSHFDDFIHVYIYILGPTST